MLVRVHRIVLFYFIVRLTFLVGVKAFRRIVYVEQKLSVLLFPIEHSSNFFNHACHLHVIVVYTMCMI